MNIAKINACFPACLAGIFLIVTVSCSTPETNVQGSVPMKSTYFSLDNYFKSEASRLQTRSPEIIKTVTKNEESETHTLQIDTWENELALFIESDINKPAWQQSYQIDSSSSNTVIYRSIDPELRTRQITVSKHDTGDIKYISIQNGVANMLYQSDERLDYYPDSLYRISRKQHIAIIGENTYAITGTFRNRP